MDSEFHVTLSYVMLLVWNYSCSLVAKLTVGVCSARYSLCFAETSEAGSRPIPTILISFLRSRTFLGVTVIETNLILRSRFITTPRTNEMW